MSEKREAEKKMQPRCTPASEPGAVRVMGGASKFGGILPRGRRNVHELANDSHLEYLVPRVCVGIGDEPHTTGHLT